MRVSPHLSTTKVTRQSLAGSDLFTHVRDEHQSGRIGSTMADTGMPSTLLFLSTFGVILSEAFLDSRLRVLNLRHGGVEVSADRATIRP
eukprot:4883782-Amphidinium_carterae.1